LNMRLQGKPHQQIPHKSSLEFTSFSQ
jgi:hypothetical protein